MKTLLTILALAASLGVANAQNDSLSDRFQQLDRNGDGKLTRDEIPQLFDQLDANRDGAVTLAEAKAYYAGGRRRQGGEGQTPAAAQTAGVPMKTFRDLPYVQIEGTDPKLTSLDVYAPENAKNCPVMVWVHGGGWARGDKAQVANLPVAFLREGFVLVSVNYRLAPQVKFDAQAQDVAAAIGWVHKHAKEYGGDPSRMFTMGHSAGAHLVALVGTDESYLRAQGLSLAALRGVVPLDTEVYDLKAFAARFGGRLPDLYASPFTQDAAVWAKASPITHVRKDKGIPPMIVAYSGGQRPHGNPDRAEYAEAFVAKLTGAGVTAEVVGAPEKTHVQIALEFGLPGDHVTEKVFGFLKRVQDVNATHGRPPGRED